MKRRIGGWISALTAVLSAPAMAAPYDGSQPLICAAFEIQACNAGDQCEAQTAEEMDAPRFLNVSVSDKTITGTRPSGDPVKATIELVHHSQEMMFLQGTQETLGWNLVIGETNGKMVLTVTDGDTGLVVFGSCTPR